MVWREKIASIAIDADNAKVRRMVPARKQVVVTAQSLCLDPRRKRLASRGCNLKLDRVASLLPKIETSGSS